MSARQLAPFLAALVAAGSAAFALSSPRASALHVARTKGGAPGTRTFAARAHKPGDPTAPTGCNLPDGGGGGTCEVDYFGGAVISNPKVYAVFWTSKVDATTKSQIGGFFQTATNSEWMDWLTEYRTDVNVTKGSGSGQPGTQQLIGRGTFAGSITIAPATTTHCVSGNSTLYDDEIVNELDAQISAGHLPPPDANTIYMTYFPPGCSINDGTASNPDSTGNSCVDLCAYHGTATSTRNNGPKSIFYYGVMPDFGTGSGCDMGCGNAPQAFDNLTTASSHELIEGVTDAQVSLSGSTFGPPLAWYDVNSGEVGDMCNQQQDILTSFDGTTSYSVQQIFSQKDYAADPATGCVTTRYEANDFLLYMNPNTAVVQAGGNALVVPITTAITNGAPAALALTVSGLPTNVTGTLDHASPAAGDAVNLTLTAASNAPLAKDVVVVVKAVGGPVVHTASLLVQVKAGVVVPNDFDLAVSSSNVSLPPGRSAALTVTTTSLNGTAQSITLAATGLPTGVTAAFAPPAVTAGSPSTLTLTATSAAAAGSSNITITGTSAAVPSGHSASALLQVDGAPAVTISTPANNGFVLGSVNVAASATAGAGARITSLTLSIDGAQVDAGTTTVSNTWDTTVVPNGNHQITAVALDSDSGTTTATNTVAVKNPPTISFSPPAANTSVKGNLTLTAALTAPLGTTLSTLQLLSDGVVVATVSAPPAAATITWDSTKTANGPHQLSAMVTDADGTSATTDSTKVTVANSSGGCATASSGGALALLFAAGALVLRRRRE